MFSHIHYAKTQQNQAWQCENSPFVDLATWKRDVAIWFPGHVLLVLIVPLATQQGIQWPYFRAWGGRYGPLGTLTPYSVFAKQGVCLLYVGCNRQQKKRRHIYWWLSLENCEVCATCCVLFKSQLFWFNHLACCITMFHVHVSGEIVKCRWVEKTTGKGRSC